MADINYNEKRKFEELLGMRSGYVLSFSDRTFREFFSDTIGIDIFDEKYNYATGSKANRLRAFITQESNYNVAVILEQLVNMAMDKYKPGDSVPDEEFNCYQDCIKVINRLKDQGIVEHLDALQPNNNDKDFKLLAKSIRESIEKNEPEVALDRLHTFVVKYVRELCTSHQITFTKQETLNAIFGKYVKHLVDNKIIESIMSEKILKYSINVIEAFNDVRNNKSLAHDNTILNYSESILIFNNVSNTLRFIQAIEENKRTDGNTVSAPDGWDDLPF
jgi:Protein of unknown function (DUF3644).